MAACMRRLSIGLCAALLAGCGLIPPILTMEEARPPRQFGENFWCSGAFRNQGKTVKGLRFEVKMSSAIENGLTGGPVTVNTELISELGQPLSTGTARFVKKDATTWEAVVRDIEVDGNHMQFGIGLPVLKTGTGEIKATVYPMEGSRHLDYTWPCAANSETAAAARFDKAHPREDPLAMVQKQAVDTARFLQEHPDILKPQPLPNFGDNSAINASNNAYNQVQSQMRAIDRATHFR